MSGGIILNRSKVLLVAATDPCIYQGLPTHCKDQIDLISAKAPADLTQADINMLIAMIAIGVNC